MTDETKWRDLESLPTEGRYLVLDARDGRLWVSSYPWKPWKDNATHWADLPSTEAICLAWKENFIRKYGEITHDDMMDGNYK